MALFKRFYYAFSGIFYLILREHNFRLHLVLFGILVFFGFYFDISKVEWISVIICSSIVLSLEAVNSSVEQLSNHLHPGQHENIKNVKDIAAGAVLIAALFSAIVACIIFFPKVYALF